MTGLEDCGSGCQLFLERAWLLLATILRPFEPHRFVDEVLLRGVTEVVVCADRSVGRGLHGYDEMWSEREMSSKFAMSCMSSWLGIDRNEDDLAEEHRLSSGGELGRCSEDMLLCVVVVLAMLNGRVCRVNERVEDAGEDARLDLLE